MSHTGALDKEEMRAILQSQSGGKPMTDAAFAELWLKIDTDNSGTIQPEEFIAYCTGGAAKKGKKSTPKKPAAAEADDQARKKKKAGAAPSYKGNKSAELKQEPPSPPPVPLVLAQQYTDAGDIDQFQDTEET